MSFGKSENKNVIPQFQNNENTFFFPLTKMDDSQNYCTAQQRVL